MLTAEHAAELSSAGQVKMSFGVSASDELGGDLRLLLVEDDYGDMLMTMQALEVVGVSCQLTCINNGDDVLPYLMNARQERLPDLILLDMGLPGTNGFELLEILAAAPAALRAVPIVMLTGYLNFDYMNKVFDLPIYGYLTKPAKADKLESILERARKDRQISDWVEKQATRR